MSNMHTNKFGKYYDKIKEMYLAGKNSKDIILEINDPELYKSTQINRIVSSLGLTKNDEETKEKFAQIDKQAIEMYKNGLSLRKISNILNIDSQALSRRLKKYYDIKILPDGKKEIDSNIFETIDTEEKAYWLGFLYADGYVSNENSFELSVQNKDSNHILKFKSFLKSNHMIQSRNVILNGKAFKQKRISIKDSQIANDLRKHGCISNKSFTISFPELDSLDLYKHFIRGFFDGDGCIMYKSSTLSCSFTSASISFLKELQLFLLEVVHVKSIISNTKSEAYDLRILSRFESILFLKYIYDNSNIYLDRKFNKYLDYCRQENILLDSLDDENGIKRGWRKIVENESLHEPKALLN